MTVFDQKVQPRSNVSGRPLQTQKVADCDVHPVVAGSDQVARLLQYLPRAWARRLELKGFAPGNSTSRLTPRWAHPSGRVVRDDAASPSGAPGGSDPEWMREDLLDRHGISAAILNCLQPGSMASGLAGPDESIVLCSAYNSYFVENWLPVDARFHYALSVPSQDIQAAATEIERLGSTPRVSAVALPLTNILAGDRYYYPVYEKAQLHGLPILFHATGTEFIYQGAATGTGWPQSYIERYVAFPSVAAANLSSLICNGAFDRFPSLRFVFAEYGFSWVLPLMWRMDKAWEELRLEIPWATRRPSEYIRSAVKFTTQPIDEPEDRQALYRLIELLGSDLLLFSSDYPHWDNDLPELTLPRLPQDERSRFLWTSASEVFGLRDSAPSTPNSAADDKAAEACDGG